MKNKIIVTLIIVLFIIFLIFSALIFNDVSKKAKTKEMLMVEAKNWSIGKTGDFYTLYYSIPESKNNNFLKDNCDIYVVDENNDLLFKTTKVNFIKEDDNFTILHVVKYDISKINKIVVTATNSTYRYNNNLMDKNYIGEKNESPKDVIIDNQKYDKGLPKTE